MPSDEPFEIIHASCVAIHGRGVLLAGPSGAGKSDLTLRLVDRGATLVSDDYSVCLAREGRLWASPPERIAGQIEVRGVGIVTLPTADETPVALYLDLISEVQRMPEPASYRVAGVDLPATALAPFEASAPIKVELLLARIGA
jgi:serine kinase of HPr protein (carbohydrate metabolism regulator)